MQVFIGVDGGGTKTDFAMMDEKGSIIGKVSRGRSYFRDIGAAQTIDLLSNGVMELFNATGVDLGRCSGVFISVAGYGEERAIDDIAAEVKRRLEPLKVGFGNDVEAGWAGSLACRPGINVISGTGANVYGRDESGASARSNGWGHWFGDEGSAYWIGLHAVMAFMRQSDHREKRTQLYGYFRDKFRLENDFDMVTYMLEEIKMDRTEISRLQIDACKLAEAGDEAALGIFDRAAEELAISVKGVIRQLSFKNRPIAVSYSGGVFKAGKIILKPLAKRLEKAGCSLEKPMFPPFAGACLLAYTAAGNRVSEPVMDNLKRTVQ